MLKRAPKGRPLQSESGGPLDRGGNDLSRTAGRDGGAFPHDLDKNEKRKKKTANAQENSCTILLGMSTGGGRDRESNAVSSDWTDMIRNGNLETRISALESLIRYHVNGDAQNHMIMYVIKYLTPLRDHYLKKLVLYFWEVVDKTDEDGNLLSEIILICSFLRNDLEHPNEYIRGVTLRFLAKVQEKELVEPLVSAVVQNLSHRVPYVRRHAALAVHAIYRRFPELLPDVVDVVEGVLYSEVDDSSRQRLFDTLADVAPERAAVFLGDYAASHDITDGGRGFLQSVVEFARERILVSVSEKAHYVPLLFAVLQSSSDAVRYDCASTLLQLSASPSAITQAARTYIEILRQNSDNTIRLIILSQLHQMKYRFADILQSSSLPDVLSIFHDEMGGLTDIRESVWELATHLISAATVGPFVSAIRKELRSVHQEIFLALNQLLLNRYTGGGGSSSSMIGSGGLSFGASANNTFRMGAGWSKGSGGGSGFSNASNGFGGGGGGGVSGKGENEYETFSPAIVALEEYRLSLLKSLGTAAQRFPEEVGELILSWLPELHLHHPALVRCNGGLNGGGGGGAGEAGGAEGGSGSDGAYKAGSSVGAHRTHRSHSITSTASRTNPTSYDAEEKIASGGEKSGWNTGGSPTPSSEMLVWVSGGTSHPFRRLASLSEMGNVEVMVVLKKILLLRERLRALPPPPPPLAVPVPVPVPPVSVTAAVLVKLREIFPQLAQSNVLRAALWLFGAFSSPDSSPAAANPLLFRIQRHTKAAGAGRLQTAVYPVFASAEEESKPPGNPQEEWGDALLSGAPSASKAAGHTLRGAAAVLAMLRQELGSFPLTAPTKTIHDTVEDVAKGVMRGDGGGGVGGAIGGGGGGMHAITTVLEDGTYGTTYVPVVPSSSHEADGGGRSMRKEPLDESLLAGRSASSPFSEDGGASVTGISGVLGESEDAAADAPPSHLFSSTTPNTTTTPPHWSFLRAMVVEGDGFVISALASAVVRLVQIQEQSGGPPAVGEVAREAGVEMLREILRYGESVWYQGSGEVPSFSPQTVWSTGGGGGGSVWSGLVERGTMKESEGGTALFETDTKEQLRVSLAMLSMAEAGTSPGTLEGMAAERGGRRRSSTEEEDNNTNHVGGDGAAMTLSSPVSHLLQGTLACSKKFITPSTLGGDRVEGGSGGGRMVRAVQLCETYGKTLHDLLPPSSLLLRAAATDGDKSSRPVLDRRHTEDDEEVEEEEEEDDEEEKQQPHHNALPPGGPPRLLDALVSSDSSTTDHSSLAITPALLSMWRRTAAHPLGFSLLTTSEMVGYAGGEDGMDGEEDEEEEDEDDDDDVLEGNAAEGQIGVGDDAIRGAAAGRRYAREVVRRSTKVRSSWSTSSERIGSGTTRRMGWAPSSSALTAIPPPAPSYVNASRRYLQRLEKAIPLSGTNDPIYCECSVHVQEFHLTVNWRLINCSSSFLNHIVIDLISLGGIKLCERPQVVSLKPYEQMLMRSSLRADGTETGVIFGYLLFDYPDGSSACLVLNNIEVDILTYVHPVTDMAQEEFRRKWRASDWENRIVIGTTVNAIQKASQKRLEVAEGSRGGSSRRPRGGTTGASHWSASSSSSARQQGRGKGGDEGEEEEEAGDERPHTMRDGQLASGAGAALEMYVALVAESLNVGRAAAEMEGEEARMAELLGIAWPLSFSSCAGGGGGGDAMVHVPSLENPHHGNTPKEDKEGERETDHTIHQHHSGSPSPPAHSVTPWKEKKEAGSCVSCNLAARTTFGEDVLVQVSVECDNTGPTALVNGGTISGIVRIRSSTHTVAYGVGKKLNGLHSELSLLSEQ